MIYAGEDVLYYNVQCEECGNIIKVNKGYVKNGIVDYVVKCEKCNKASDKIKNIPLKCPRCGSFQLTANNKGFSLGKAVAGGIAFGAVGLLGGFIGSKDVMITCLQCGHKWKAGKDIK